jgi:hypothetical protein
MALKLHCDICGEIIKDDTRWYAVHIGTKETGKSVTFTRTEDVCIACLDTINEAVRKRTRKEAA